MWNVIRRWVLGQVCARTAHRWTKARRIGPTQGIERCKRCMATQVVVLRPKRSKRPNVQPEVQTEPDAEHVERVRPPTGATAIRT